MDEQIENLQADIATLTAASSGSVPSGFVGSFNLTACPSGWQPADGRSNRPDLRGVFVRGMEDFGSGRVDRDPNRSGSNTLGSYQGDDFKSHDHYTAGGTGLGSRDTNGHFRTSTSGTSVNNRLVRHTGGSETRPKNVALLFCVKE